MDSENKQPTPLSSQKRRLLAQLVKNKGGDDFAKARTPRRRAADQQLGPLPLSFAQQRLWFLEQLAPGNIAYNIPAAVRLSGQLDIKSLEASMSEVVRRHEALRTRFVV